MYKFKWLGVIETADDLVLNFICWEDINFLIDSQILAQGTSCKN